MLTMIAGYPKVFVSKFLQGFPDDWHSVIEEFYIRGMSVFLRNIFSCIKCENLKIFQIFNC